MGILLISEMNLTHLYVYAHTHMHANLLHRDVLSGFHCTNPMHLILLISVTTKHKIQTTLHDAPQH